MSKTSASGSNGRRSCEPDTPQAVPPPLTPDDPDAWYAPNVRAQYEVHPGVVATITETADGFHYKVREPSLAPAERDALERVADHYADANLSRPLTREGAIERVAAGVGEKHRRIIDRLTDLGHGRQCQVEYYALANLQCLGQLTPYALDETIEIADAAEENLVVHTTNYAPADADLPADPDYLERFASERIESHTVDFQGFPFLWSSTASTFWYQLA